MINKQRLSYQLWEEKIPLSKHLLNYLKRNNLKKSNFISNGDDYQILFTACSDKSRIIQNTSKKLGIKITKIGKIILNNKKSSIITKKGKYLLIKNSGYKHQF
jgi:thiamine-monophosphate kinase